MLLPARRNAVAAGAVLLVLLALAVPSGALAAQLNVGGIVRRSWDAWQNDFPFFWPPYLALGLILVLERRFPARPRPSGSPGVCLDLLWMLLAVPVWFFVVAGYVRILDWTSRHALGAYALDLEEHLPFAVFVAVSFVVGDFLAWVYHYLKHRVPVLWRFHVVHHSTIDMNPFADARNHVAENFVNRTITVLPFLLLGGDAREGLVALLLVQVWYARFYHSNIRTNLGPLRHVLVTPQYHRVHHSVDAQDADQNFGNFLTVWDRLFGTLVRDYDRYPQTGVVDRAFPHPASRQPVELVRSYGAQLAYPFTARSLAPAER